MTQSNKPKLTDKQRRFVEEYLLDCNGAAAARRAGYSEKTANRIATTLLSKVVIQEEIARAMTKLANKLEIKAETVLEELARLAFSDIGEVLDFTGEEPRLRPVKDIPLSARRAIASVKTKRFREGRGEAAKEVEVTEFRLWDKNSALEKLAKCLKLFASEEDGRLAKLIDTIEIRLSGGSQP